MIKTEEQVLTSTTTDRRRYPRLDKKARLQSGFLTYPIKDEDFAVGTMDNISLGGIKMHSSRQYEDGSLLQIKLTLPGWHKYHTGFLKVLEDSIGTPLTAVCEVLRSEREGREFTTALRFINVDPEDFSALECYLDKQINS